MIIDCRFSITNIYRWNRIGHQCYEEMECGHHLVGHSSSYPVLVSVELVEVMVVVEEDDDSNQHKQSHDDITIVMDTTTYH